MHVLVDGANVGRFSTFQTKGKGKKKGKKGLPAIDLAQICSAMSSLREQFNDAEVTLFLFEDVIDVYERRNEPGLAQILAADANCITKVPSRSDVDEFILQEAIRLSDAGGNVRVVTNDNFDEYVFPKGHKAIDRLTEERLRQWLSKFTFSRGRFVLQPSAGSARRGSVVPVAPATDEDTDMISDGADLDVEMTDRSPDASSEKQVKWEEAVLAFTRPVASIGTSSSTRPVPGSLVTSSQLSNALKRATNPVVKTPVLQEKLAPRPLAITQSPVAKAGDTCPAGSHKSPSTAKSGDKWKMAANAWHCGTARKEPATAAEKRGPPASHPWNVLSKKRKLSSNGINVDADGRPKPPAPPTRKFIYNTSHPDFKKPPSWDKIDEILGRKRPRHK